jgi:tricorn protease-like protein
VYGITSTGNAQTVVTDLMTDDQTILNENTALHQVTWSSDSQWVTSVNSFSVSIWNVMSGEMKTIANLGNTPKWSPNGEHIAYVSPVPNAQVIQIVTIQTGETRKITSNDRLSSAPYWSSDGKQLFFQSQRDSHHEYFMLDMETGTIQKLAEFSGRLGKIVPINF